jgi:hypothetical protein
VLESVEQVRNRPFGLPADDGCAGRRRIKLSIAGQ